MGRCGEGEEGVCGDVLAEGFWEACKIRSRRVWAMSDRNLKSVKFRAGIQDANLPGPEPGR